MTVNCPSCNQRIEIPRAATPPRPQQPSAAPPPVPFVSAAKQTPPVKRTNPAVPILTGIFILFAFVVIGFLVQNNSSSPASPAKNPVKTHVGLTASAVAITNLDEYAWPGVKVYVNGNPLVGYKAVYDRQVAPHERILIPLTDFARGDQRFNPVERKVTQVIVWVEDHDAPIFSFQ